MIVSLATGCATGELPASSSLYAFVAGDSVVLRNGDAELAAYPADIAIDSGISYTSDHKFIFWVTGSGVAGTVTAVPSRGGDVASVRCNCDRAVRVADGKIVWLQESSDPTQPSKIMRWSPHAGDESTAEVWRKIPPWYTPKYDLEYMARHGEIRGSLGDRLFLTDTAYSRSDSSARTNAFEILPDGSMNQFGRLDGITDPIEGAVYEPNGAAVVVYTNSRVGTCGNPQIIRVDTASQAKSTSKIEVGRCARATEMRWNIGGPVTTIDEGSAPVATHQWVLRTNEWRRSERNVADMRQLDGETTLELQPDRSLLLVRGETRTTIAKSVRSIVTPDV